MHKGKIAGISTDFLDDTDMTHRAGRARATEEDQIARLQVGNTLDRRAFLILAAGTAGNIQIILTIDVTGKTGTIEILGTGSSGTITNVHSTCRRYKTSREESVQGQERTKNRATVAASSGCVSTTV